MNNKHLTTYLFASPSFLEGMARVLDTGSVFDVYNDSEGDADFIALRNDWMMVGEDIRYAIKEYDRKYTRAQRSIK